MALDLTFTDEQHAVAELFDSFFEKECSSEMVRRAQPLGFDPVLWSKLDSLGAPAMSVSEQAGGGGAGFDVLSVVAERVGRAAAPVPLIDHLVASRALAAPDADVLAGRRIATVSIRPARAGRWALVPSGAVASVVIGVDQGRLVGVASTPPMVAPRNTADMPLADREVAGENVELRADATWAAVRMEWKVLSAAALVGLAQRALELGVDYALTREQFGKPIGAFQAVQHGLADLPGLVDGARLLVQKAAWALDRQATGIGGVVDPLDNDVSRADALAAMAFNFAGEVAARVTDRSLHYHGAFGYSLESDVQLYFRRARGWSLIGGDPEDDLLELADTLFGTV